MQLRHRVPAAPSPARALPVAAVFFSVAASFVMSAVLGCTPAVTIGGPCGVMAADGTSRFQSGADPCSEQFYYPTGVTVDNDGDVLYVSNGNSDLRYSGGTLNAVDAVFFECALKWAKAGYTGPKPAGCENFPLEQICQLGDDVNGNFNDVVCLDNPKSYTGCRVDKNDPAVFECDEQLFIRDAVRVGNFGGRIREQVLQDPAVFNVYDSNCPAGSETLPVTDGGTEIQVSDAGATRALCSAPYPASRRLWLPVRGDPSITYVNLMKPPPVTGSPSPSGVKLSCNGTSPGTDVPVSCSDQRITIRDYHRFITPGAPGAVCSEAQPDDCVELAPEPFGIFLDEGCTDGSPRSPTTGCTGTNGSPYSHLLISHLLGGEVTLIDAAAEKPTSTQDDFPSENIVLDVRAGFFPADANMRHGAFSVSPRVPGDPTSWWYVTSDLNPVIGQFQITGSNQVVVGNGFTVAGGPYSVGSDVRDLIFDPCPDAAGRPTGCRAFAVQNNPPSLFTLDTRIDPTVPPAGAPRTHVQPDIVPLCQGPSHLGRRSYILDGPEGPQVVTRIYALCFNSNQATVVDPDLGTVVGVITTGVGPNDISFNFADNSAPPAGLPRRGYITDYVDMNISVVDLEPGSPTENRVIGRIGIASPPTTVTM